MKSFMCLCKKIKKQQPLKRKKNSYKKIKNETIIKDKIQHQNGMQL
jgi:hypothetical protein